MNGTLAERAGTEMALYDMAVSMAARGHQVRAYAPRLGEVAEELRNHSVAVTGSLRWRLRAPDVIHGQQHGPTLEALKAFPETPAVYVCHGAIPDQEKPPRHPNILQYVAVDEPCRVRVFSEVGVNSTIIPNSVDLDLFRRGIPLPGGKPSRALFFGNGSPAKTLRVACSNRKISLDVIGRPNHPCDCPWEVLPKYDVVFAKGRCALEAMACGAAVLLASGNYFGPMVTASQFEYLRLFNFGYKMMKRPWAVKAFLRELDRYDPKDASAVTDRVREVAGLAAAADRFEALYKAVLSWPPRTPSQSPA